MRAAQVCGLTLCLACLVPASAGLDWRGRLLAAVDDTQQPSEPLTQLLRASDGPHPCNQTSDCCDNPPGICECLKPDPKKNPDEHAGGTCQCYEAAYWQKAADACVTKGELGHNCTHDEGACRPSHSSCQKVGTRGITSLCECDYQYYPDSGGCIRVQSPFFTTTIIVSICILFAAVAIGVVMQIRSNMQRRLFQRQYGRHAELDAMLAAQRRARQRRAAQRRANPARRYSDEAAPDEPPPPYVPIFTTRSSGDWGKLPSYQEADNEAFEMEEGVFTRTEVAPSSSPPEEAPAVAAGAPSVGTGAPLAEIDVPSAETEAPAAQTVAPGDQCQPTGADGGAPWADEATPAGGDVPPCRLPQLTNREAGPESLLRRTGSI